MANKVSPIKPGEVVKEKEKSIPDAVFEAFNQLIAENFNGYSATVLQKDVVALMKEKGVNIGEAYKKGWLDVEDIYRKAGWKVEYDKPGYNESYDASFEFSRKK